MELPESVYDTVEELSANGSDLFDEGEFSEAITQWSEALDLLPEPKSDWEAYTWLSASIGDGYYQLANVDAARQAFFDALNGPGGQDTPFVHYRLGQCEVRLGHEDAGISHLLKAYMLDGQEIFTGEADGLSFLQRLKNKGLIP